MGRGRTGEVRGKEKGAGPTFLEKWLTARRGTLGDSLKAGKEKEGWTRKKDREVEKQENEDQERETGE